MTSTHPQRLGTASGPARRLLAMLAGLLTTLALIVSAATPASAHNAVGPQPIQTILTVGPHEAAGQTSIGVRGPSQQRQTSATGVAAETSGNAAYHYTRAQVAASIEKNGLLKGSYATMDGTLSPLQAQIDLALPPNRGLPGALIRVDLGGLRAAGYEIAQATRVGRSFNMPGGGTEMQFPYAIPPEFLKVLR